MHYLGPVDVPKASTTTTVLKKEDIQFAISAAAVTNVRNRFDEPEPVVVDECNSESVVICQRQQSNLSAQSQGLPTMVIPRDRVCLDEEFKAVRIENSMQAPERNLGRLDMHK